uniref:Integrase catalytic domain-containing protein n=1 Tax=Biomphalaria glabrata TaxID=6526 RepID=A0A2C9LXF3_BIOGL
MNLQVPMPNIEIEKTDKASLPLEKVSIDIIGPMPHTSSEGQKYALTIIDSAFRYTEVTPLRTITIKQVYKPLIQFFTKFGFTSFIISDNGSQNQSPIRISECPEKLLSIEHRFKSIYHLSPMQQVARTYTRFKEIFPFQ